ncbi:LPS assembly protein LptD [Methylovorus menthalis]|uniref:LPS-assembly protein LptD n=1 Tax=Methylovorus menthalis TaxID=1002227 RepID=UPI001E3B1051|nr:LPS assembly protein LptD [Methylovorus menthalis]MCB4810476.1 LPS assembly protein LptD [Methylovorus menthalis]
MGSAPLQTVGVTSQPGEVVIEGDKLQMNLGRKMKATGNASLHQQSQDVYGDVIDYDEQNEALHVLGNARIESGGGVVTGPELRMQLHENIGEMRDASFKLNNQFSGIPLAGAGSLGTTKTFADPNEVIADTNYAGGASAGTSQISSQNLDDRSSNSPGFQKKIGASRGDASAIFFEGQDKKRLKSARYTTCEVGRDDWYIKASDLELDDYTKTATARNARVEFMNTPILYTPWISFSFLNQRKTGLLSPTFGTTSRSGFELLTPFYWNIAPNMDATVATRYLGTRGMQYQGEFRYLGETYSGIDNVEYLPSDSSTGDTRYYMRFKHDQILPNGWSTGYQFEKVSDDKYFSELSTRITVTSRVNLPQQAYLNYSDDTWNFNGLVQKYQTLDGISYPYERLPQLTLTGNKDVGAFNTNLYTQWVSFDRNPSSPLTSTTASGQVLTTSVTGNRFTAYPSVSLPMARPYGYITPKIGLHYTSYGLQNTEYTLGSVSGNYESTNRSLPIVSLDSGLFYDRQVRVVKNMYTQTLEPRLYYVYIPYRDQSMLPVFDSSESDLSMSTLFLENQFNGNDRINNANQITLAVTSRMIDSRTGEQRLAATIGQRFYFADQKVGVPGANLRTGDSSDIVTALTAKLLNKWSLDTAWQFNTDRSRTTKANIGARYNPEPGKVLNIGYRYTEDRLEQINLSSQWPLGNGWYGLGRWNYSLRETRPIEGLAGIEYNAGCWQARTVLQRVSTATASANYAFFIQLELGGLASIGSNPLTLLNRGIPGYTSTGLLPDTVQQQPSSYE